MGRICRWLFTAGPQYKICTKFWFWRGFVVDQLVQIFDPDFILQTQCGKPAGDPTGASVPSNYEHAIFLRYQITDTDTKISMSITTYIGQHKCGDRFHLINLLTMLIYLGAYGRCLQICNGSCSIQNRFVNGLCLVLQLSLKLKKKGWAATLDTAHRQG